jgi:predicted alpha/beta superfamily hydrolase
MDEQITGSKKFNPFRTKRRKKGRIGRNEIIGTADLHENFPSKFLKNERSIIVWLPPKYKRARNSEKRYPVLYMHDGQNIIDPKTSFAGADWRVDETVTRLIEEQKMKEIIVVGIYNNEDRLEEYSDSEKGKNYLRFIVEELKPFIGSNYRTLVDRNNTAIMGSSMGGLTSFLAALKYPEIFSMAGCMSSSFYYNNNKVFSLLEEDVKRKNPVKFYIDHGEDGLKDGQKMFCKLTRIGFVIGTDLDYYYARGAEHHENAWAERLERPLLFFFGK